LKYKFFVLLGIIFAILGTFLISYGFWIRDEETKTMRGELATPEVDYQEPFYVNFGSNILIQTIDDLSEGINLRRFIDIGYDYPIQIRFKDKKLSIYAEIKNDEGVTIAKIVDNNWLVNENNMIAWDRNYNYYAFEVIDSELIPVLQVVLESQNSIYIGGFFRFPNGRMLVTPTGIIINPSEDQISEHVKCIFRYPSEKNLGMLVEMNLVTTLFGMPWSTWVILVGVVCAALGLILIENDKLRRKVEH
jgi:hypothetical protein